MNNEAIREIAYEHGRKKALEELKKFGKVKGTYRGRTPKKYKDFDFIFGVSAFEGYTEVYYQNLKH